MKNFLKPILMHYVFLIAFSLSASAQTLIPSTTSKRCKGVIVSEIVGQIREGWALASLMPGILTNPDVIQGAHNDCKMNVGATRAQLPLTPKVGTKDIYQYRCIKEKCLPKIGIK
jgi:hypothetical protein